MKRYGVGRLLLDSLVCLVAGLVAIAAAALLCLAAMWCGGLSWAD